MAYNKINILALLEELTVLIIWLVWEFFIVFIWIAIVLTILKSLNFGIMNLLLTLIVFAIIYENFIKQR